MLSAEKGRLLACVLVFYIVELSILNLPLPIPDMVLALKFFRMLSLISEAEALPADPHACAHPH